MFETHPPQKVSGTVAGLYAAEGETFVSRAVETLPLTFEGIPSDVHSGHTRRSGSREPWYRRGTEMRNERQLSILSEAELAEIASALDVPRVAPEWIGGNVTLDGIVDLSRLPPRTLVFFEAGVTLKIDGDNNPCRLSGRSIAQHYEGRDDIEMAFSKVAKGKRGLVAWVEKPGTLRIGEAFEARVPPQWDLARVGVFYPSSPSTSFVAPQPVSTSFISSKHEMPRALRIVALDKQLVVVRVLVAHMGGRARGTPRRGATSSRRRLPRARS